MRNTLKYCLLLLCFSACTDDRVFEENHDFEETIWTIDKDLSFSFDIDNNSKYYKMLLNLRYDLEYPYRNLYVYYKLEDSSQNTLDKALVNYTLFNPKEGKPLGTGSSNIFSYQQVLIDSLQFPQEGEFTISLAQYMRTDSLSGIYSAGIKIIKQPTAAE